MLARLVPQTARRWLQGYAFRHEGQPRRMPPVGGVPGTTAGVSFLDLIELVAIRGLKEMGFSLRGIRLVVDNCRSALAIERPLVMLRFSVAGRDVFVESGAALVEVGRHRGQAAWHEVIEPYLESLDFGDVFAERWWPLGRGSNVVVDPEFGFGLPVVAGSGVRTETLLERFRAGDLAATIADDFQLREKDVERALQFEVTRRAA